MKKTSKPCPDPAQLCRVFRMEARMMEARHALNQLKDALNLYEAHAEVFDQLARYLASPEWRADYEADEAGALGDAFPRGVLSEDGLYNLLQEHADVLRRLAQIFASPQPSDHLLAD